MTPNRALRLPPDRRWDRCSGHSRLPSAWPRCSNSPPTAYRIVKIAGGLYLIYLGLRVLLRRRQEATANFSERSTAERAPAAAFGSGLMSCALNPKVGLFFLAIVPQFVPSHASLFATVLTLGMIDTAVAFAWLLVIASLAARAVTWLRRPRVTTLLNRVSAAILTTFGVATVASAE